MAATTAKLFEIRNKIKSSDEDQLKDHLDRFLQEVGPDPDNCHHLLDYCFTEQRSRFVKAAHIIKKHTKSILSIKLKEHPLLLDLCRLGTADEVNEICKIESISNIDRAEECVDFVVRLRQKDRKDEKQMVEILKVLESVDPQIITNCNPKNIVEAIENQQFQVAEFLIAKGADVSFESKEKENLLHILMRKYNKREDKVIMNIRSLLVGRGIDERKYNTSSKRPYDLCPADVRARITEEHKSQIPTRKMKGDENNRYKGKSEEGLEIGRAKGHQYREKTEVTHLIKLENPDEVFKIADSCVQRRTKEKQRELNERERERMDERSKEKERERKEKINKKIFSPEELKHFLNEEISYCVEQIEKENELQKAALDQLIGMITSQIHQKVGATVKIFGSFATGLSLLESDIDMVIIPESDKEMESSFSLLEKISDLLETMGEEVESVKYIKTASVPILKIQCTKKYESKKIDITYKDQNHNGLDSVERIQKYLEIYPSLKPLVLVLKKFIYSTNIYDPYSGGLSSYGLILMIVAYLQQDNRQRKSKGVSDPSKQPTIAELLIGFLNFYGFKSTYINKQICVLDPEKAKQEMTANYIYPEQAIYIDAMDMEFMMYPNDWQPRAKLVIIDPLNPKNNIGRATHKIRQIKTAFQMAYVCIHTNRTCKSRKTCESYRRIMSVNLKDTKYENYKRPCCIIKRMLNSMKSLTTC